MGKNKQAPGSNFLILSQDKVFQSNLKFSDFINNPKLCEMLKGLGQGSLLEDKVTEMVEEYILHPEYFAHKRIITISIMNNNYYIVDGQHRIEMAKRLYSNNEQRKDDYFICIWHYVNNEEEMRNIFDSINIDSIKNEMYVSQDVFQKSRIDTFIKYFWDRNNGWRKNFAKTWSDEPEKKKQTRYTVEKVRDSLIENHFFNRECHAEKNIYNDFKSSETFIDYICRSNLEFYNILAHRYKDHETLDNLFYSEEKNNILESKVFMLCRNNFFEWLMNKQTIEPHHEVKTAKKKTIPISIRKNVWRAAYQDQEVCECPFFRSCRKILDYNKKNGWHCGHIISEENGGPTELGNLRPICQSCNSSMGTRNWNDYVEHLKGFNITI